MPLKPSIGGYDSWKLSQKPENVRYSPWNGQKTWNFWAITHGNGGRKHEKHEFLRCLSNQVSVVTLAGNCPGNRKMCAIAHEMGKNMKTVSYSPWKWRQKTWKSRVFATPLKPSIDGYGSWKSSWEPENVRYSPWNGQKHETISSSPRKWRLKTWKTLVFATPLKPGIGGYGSWKLSQKPENVRYSPWNGQKTWKLWAITHGNGGRNHEKHEFLRRLSNQVSVVTVAGNSPGNQKMCSIAHEMGKNMKTVSYSPWKWRQKTWKSRVFATPLKPIIGGYGSWKSS